MNMMEWDQIAKMLAIAPMVGIALGIGYWMAIRGSDQDIKDMKEALKHLEQK